MPVANKCNECVYCARNLFRLFNSGEGSAEIHIPCRVENVRVAARNEESAKATVSVPNLYVKVVFVIIDVVVNIITRVVIMDAVFAVASGFRGGTPIPGCGYRERRGIAPAVNHCGVHQVAFDAVS